MDPSYERPRVADLRFTVFDRPVHPELFDAVAVRAVRTPDYTFVARVTAAGHVLEWRRGDVQIVEVIATLDAPLPRGGRLAHPFAGSRRGKFRSAGVRYEMGLHAEVLPPEIFLKVHDELAADATRRGLACRLRPRHRFGLAPLGFVTADHVAGGLAVATFHTYPAEYAVVKTQSLFEPR